MLTKIFEYLANESTLGTSSIRLTYSPFKALSSPVLLDTVVLNQRLRDSKKLGGVIEHRYFRLHVTELLHDASSYQEGFMRPGEYKRHIQMVCSKPVSYTHLTLPTKRIV